MPYSTAQRRVCVDCETSFEAMNYNQDRCPDCQAAYQRTHRARPVKNDIMWINQFIDNNDWSINCPRCGCHMSLCRCPDPTVTHFEPPAVEMWEPWK